MTDRDTAAESTTNPAPAPAPSSIGPTPRDVLLWVGIYFLLALVPLGIALLGDPPHARGFWIEFGVALGFVALSLFVLEFALTARFKRIGTPFGTDTLLHFHRQAGIGAFFFVVGHVVVLLVAHRPYLAFLDFRVMVPRSLALWGVLGALVLLLTLAIWRKQLRVPYQWWRASHALLAIFVVFVGIVHAIQVGYYTNVWWKQGLLIGFTALAFGLILHSRLWTPLQMRKHPYRITDIKAERGDSWTLTLEPVGHQGMDFEAGQFAWLAVGPSPFVIDAHPFSFSSSAQRPDAIQFTIKELGDWTRVLGDLPKGSTAFLNGPYGTFSLAPEASGAVFIAGGIGITPMMSILRTLSDRDDPRPITLVYAVKHWDEATFREDLEHLETKLNLTTVYVVEKPPENWQGESGFLTPGLLRRVLPPDEPCTEYFICGPEPMMDIAEPFLKKDAGVPARRINAERFDIA